jgi:hypothetical protein
MNYLVHWSGSDANEPETGRACKDPKFDSKNILVWKPLKKFSCLGALER